MRLILTVFALATGTAASAQTAYSPADVRIMRTDVRTENQTDGIVTCATGTIHVSGRDDVTISLRPCRDGDGPVRSVSSTNQRGGITAGVIVSVTNSPGAITGGTVNIGRVEMHGGSMTITGVTGGMMTTGAEDAIVRRCLAQARASRTSHGDRTYRDCLRALLGREGWTLD